MGVVGREDIDLLVLVVMVVDMLVKERDVEHPMDQVKCCVFYDNAANHMDEDLKWTGEFL